MHKKSSIDRNHRRDSILTDCKLSTEHKRRALRRTLPFRHLWIGSSPFFGQLNQKRKVRRRAGTALGEVEALAKSPFLEDGLGTGPFLLRKKRNEFGRMSVAIFPGFFLAFFTFFKYSYNMCFAYKL
jgi:hypothetical protein